MPTNLADMSSREAQGYARTCASNSVSETASGESTVGIGCLMCSSRVTLLGAWLRGLGELQLSLRSQHHQGLPDCLDAKLLLQRPEEADDRALLDPQLPCYLSVGQVLGQQPGYLKLAVRWLGVRLTCWSCGPPVNRQQWPYRSTRGAARTAMASRCFMPVFFRIRATWLYTYPGAVPLAASISLICTAPQ